MMTVARKKTTDAWLTAALSIALGSAACAETSVQRAIHKFGGPAMGSTYRVKYWVRESSTASPSHDDLQRDAEKILALVDKQMSTWRDDSELAKFNRAPAGEWVTVSPELATVAAAAERWHRKSGGAHDVTVGPLVRVWGFGPGGAGVNRKTPQELAAPSGEKLAQARERVGMDLVELSATPQAMKKRLAGVEVDLSSIAPGYAVDQIGAALVRRGVIDWLIDVGGEMKSRGTRPDGALWQVGIERPGGGEPLAIALRDTALATSGDYRNYAIVGSRQVAHIVDPRTGQALQVRGLAVTILATSCMDADAAATAAVVLGPQAGYAWCNEHGIAALFQRRGATTGDTWTRITTRWRELLTK